MLAEITSYFHRLRWKLNRSEWAIKHLRLPVSEGVAEEPGLLLIQIDGFARAEFEKAMADGRMPFLTHLHKRSGYQLTTFYPGLPSTTPAVQAELYYGVKAGVPAFSFMDRATGEIGSMFEPARVKSFEAQFARQGENLLAGGSSWSNIYSGGAAKEDCHFCVSSLGLGEVFRRGRLAARLLFMGLHPWTMVRIAGLVLMEMTIGVWDLLIGLCKRQQVILEFGALLSRVCVGIAVREFLRIGGKIDLTRGLPIVHLNFLGYDETSHRRGPASGFARWTLRGIDGAIEDLYRCAHLSKRRDYQIWIFSDHGQDCVRSFETESAHGTRQLIAECLALGESRIHRYPEQARLSSRRRYEQGRKKATPASEEGFRLAAMGPVGHLYFTDALGDEQKRVYAQKLVLEGQIPVVLHLQADGRAVWYDADGALPVARAAMQRLKRYPDRLRREMAQDLVRLCECENAGDLILLGYGGKGDCWTFVAERGAHAGLAPQESHGFLLTPPATLLPEGSEEFVRPAGLREAVLHALGRGTLVKANSLARHVSQVRVLSYNVHGCAGMDGRISPRRIARVIAQQNADIVALQEIDHGRQRSRGEDQANLIADLLGYHMIFCPTVVVGEERYGHAVLSRLPLEIVKVGELPSFNRGVWPEKRGALWTRVQIDGQSVNVLTTHLGLSSYERQIQMRTLLGSEWLGPVLEREPILFCGDLNCRPGGRTYRIAAAMLHDVASSRGVSTFSSIRPLVRLDYIFTTPHFETSEVRVARSPLTRISSDHLPLVADLVLMSSPEQKMDGATASSGK